MSFKTYTVGRSKKADFIIDDASVSRIHLEITVTHLGRIYCIDCRSTQGTFINKNGHLPWLTAAKDERDGVNMTRMSFETLEAVENLQLQVINLRKENLKLKQQTVRINKQEKERNTEINELKKENLKQQQIINKLIKRIEKLENK